MKSWYYEVFLQTSMVFILIGFLISCGSDSNKTGRESADEKEDMLI